LAVADCRSWLHQDEGVNGAYFRKKAASLNEPTLAVVPLVLVAADLSFGALMDMCRKAFATDVSRIIYA
jgi:hypothetical protein